MTVVPDGVTQVLEMIGINYFGRPGSCHRVVLVVADVDVGGFAVGTVP